MTKYIECGECDAKLSPSWMIDGEMIVMDSMMTDKDYVYAEPWIASHMVKNPTFDDKCTKCKFDFRNARGLSACLVNHGDNTACLSCPECNEYVSKSALWHKTKWERKDLMNE